MAAERNVRMRADHANCTCMPLPAPRACPFFIPISCHFFLFSSSRTSSSCPRGLRRDGLHMTAIPKKPPKCPICTSFYPRAARTMPAFCVSSGMICWSAGRRGPRWRWRCAMVREQKGSEKEDGRLRASGWRHKTGRQAGKGGPRLRGMGWETAAHMGG